jgi:quercetin dioxygenase-like cupin family protein
MQTFMRVITIVAFVLMGAFTSLAQESQKENQQHDHLMVVPSAVKWSEGPGSLPPGAKFTVIEGDPSKAAPFTMRLNLPKDYKIPPHWHPAIEHVTVLEGSLYMGLGENIDASKATELPIGGFAVMQIGTRHFAFTKNGAIVQLHGVGPWGINYVNPADDPRKKTP